MLEGAHYRTWERADADTQECPEAPAVAWAHWLQAELGACEGVCGIQPHRGAAPPGEAVGWAGHFLLSLRPRPSHPAAVKVLAFEGGGEATVPIPAGGDLDLLTETSWGREFLRLGCLTLSIPPTEAIPAPRSGAVTAGERWHWAGALQGWPHVPLLTRILQDLTVFQEAAGSA